MRAPRTPRGTERAGFTILELVVAVSLTLVVFAITLPFVRVQTEALGNTAGRLDAEQVARYAQRAIDKDLRLAVADPGQPLIVYAGPMGIAFNVNLVAPDTTDPNALGVESGALSSLTEAWRVADATVIPKTTRTYPTVDYTDAGGALSRNETVMYFLHADTVTGRTDIYVLYRRVNARDSVQIVRGIHVPADSAFFTYQRMVSGSMTAIAQSSLPLYWDSTLTAEIRAVQLRSAGFYRPRRASIGSSVVEDVIRTVYWSVVLTNLSASGRDCGAAPVQPADSKFKSSVRKSKPSRVELDWDDSDDDASGAGDVGYYLLEKKRSAASTWSSMATVPATRSSAYRWSEMNPTETGSFDYSLRAVDCGGAMSTRALENAVSLP